MNRAERRSNARAEMKQSKLAYRRAKFNGAQRLQLTPPQATEIGVVEGDLVEINGTRFRVEVPRGTSQ